MVFRVHVPLLCRAALLSVAIVASPCIALAGDQVSVTAEMGVIDIEANEYVYSGSSKISQLIWQSRSPAATGQVDIPLRDGWGLRVEGTVAWGTVAWGGDGYMEDYDWLAPYATGTGPDDWSHRSQHPDTRLDHHFSADLAVTRTLYEDEGASVGLRGGARYTDTQWTAYGGTYLYSVGGFRDTPGSIGDGVMGITYRQTIPEIYQALDAEMTEGALTLRLSGRVGVAIGAKGDDDHWLRDLNFLDVWYPIPTAGVEAGAELALGERAALTASAGLDKVFATRADTIVTDTLTDLSATFPNGGGGDYRSIRLSAGLKGSF
ncbi:omptin family outer membrane protease [Cucumibacter marinus]|uniref:omptin family outer membrane protease n=1 Tax=Cucumibacter marinus TaxID=1121252 RepID=UPI00068525F8|nr:omptin family outer membrane protease [Cucumibacter marinus]